MRKGVSPLIAAVLLIAFTMAVAAILTAWISNFTTQQKEKTAEFEEKVQCAYADIRADPNFARYNTSTGFFSVWIENTGSEKISVAYMTIEFSDGKITRKMPLNTTHVMALQKREGGTVGPLDLLGYAADTAKSGISASISDIPQKVTFTTTCDGVKTSLLKPTTGWVSN